MALSQIELDYLRDNDHLFNTGDLATILNGLMKSALGNEIGQRSAKRLGLFSALSIDEKAIKLIVENRGQSRSKYRADAGQQILRVHYGIDVPGIDGHLTNEAFLATIPTWQSLDGKGYTLFEFTYFKGTLRPDKLKGLMREPLIAYNKKVFDKPLESLVDRLINETHWG